MNKLNKKHYKRFTNRACEFFPCHKLNEDDTFNCLFCFCPLYPLSDCGGRFKRLPGGIKDCTDCTLPHTEGGYDYIIKRLRLTQ